MTEIGPHLLGCLPSEPEVLAQAHPLARYLATPETFDPSFALTTIIPPLDQDGGKCVAFSGALIRSSTEWPEAGGEVDFDADDLYLLCVPGDPAGNQGTSVSRCCAVLKATGALAKDGPHKGQRLKIGAYAGLQSISDYKTAILAGGAHMAVSWANAWFTPKADGTLPIYDFEAGGHAIPFIGWDDTHVNPDGTRGAFLAQNSWGPSWGVKGRFWFPYSYAKYIWEAWKTIDAPDPGGNMIGFSVIDPLGTVVVPADPAIRGQNLTTGASVVVPSGTYQVLGGISLNAQFGPAGTDGKTAYVIVVAGAFVALLARNGVFTPANTSHAYTVTRDGTTIFSF
jgi:hypothetical protein